MLQMTIGGTLGRDPETRATSSGKEVTTFNVAVNGYDFSKREKTTTWVKVTMWGERGTKLGDMLAKGDRVMASGIGRLNTYENKDGETKTSLELTADQLAPMGGSKRSDDEDERPARTSSKKPPAAKQQSFPDSDDDIPF